ncbi:Small-conductance mechanosensitive channel [Haladaptatus litoreus]|uniref:Small-conductance mechanosensitive channel n=1 Tax=Haladaptatus litoreus TaxID=553468 RepID=A0A1N6W414_9EURY|nr:mechanosensitive ion channel family protein [Haladaptatus litoreus]SIQ84732.1 Small-conductance mechanosensitive channel [Haladaptatus litoreus]
MPNSLRFLSTVIQQLPVPDARVLLSTFLLVVLVFVTWILWKVAPRLKRRMNPRLVDVLLLTTSGLAAIFIGQYTLALWTDDAAPAPQVDLFSQLTSAGVRLAITFGVLAAAYVGAGMFVRVIDRFITQSEQITGHQGEVIARVGEVCVYLLAGLLLLGVWRVDVRAFLIGAGFLGIIIGLAANETLSSLIAGFTLMFSRPFEIGDWIRIPIEGNEDDEGIVTDITLFTTRIETFSGEYVIIPNDVVGSSTITNYGRKGRLRLEVEVGIDYSTDPYRAISVAERTMTDVAAILEVPRPRAVLTGFGDSAILLELRFWIDRPSSRRKWRAITAVVADVKTAYERDGIEIPFPQRALSAREETGFRVVDGRETEREQERREHGRERRIE